MLKRLPHRPSFSPTPHMDASFRSSLTVFDKATPRSKTRRLFSLTPRKPKAPSINVSYISSIFDSLYDKQLSAETCKDISQSIQNPQMRHELVAWIFLLCSKFGLKRNTLYSAVMIFDRCSHQIELSTQNLQLYGATALWLSTKMHCPKIISLKAIMKECADIYSKEDFLKSETSLLDSLKYTVSVTCVCDFIEIIETQMNPDRALQSLLLFFSDIHLQFSGFLRFKPSTIACAALIYALSCLGKPYNLLIIDKFVEREEWKVVYECVEELHRIINLVKNGKKNSILEKASPDLYYKAINLISRPILPSIQNFLTLFDH